jgi:Thioesterase-like superfamily
MPDPAASFIPRGDVLVPTASTEGGWSPGTLMGRYLAGLVARGAESHGEPDLQPSRLTVDMFRPATMGPTSVTANVVRAGRRIKVVDVDVTVGDVLVCRGSVVFLRRAAPPRGAVWLPQHPSFPAPDTLGRHRAEHWTPAWDHRPHGEWGSVTDSRGCWIAETHAFVEGEETSPFVRAALAADNANGCINASPIGLPYINADLTMTLARLPVGDWIGLVPVSRAVADGVSVGTIDLHDTAGRIGQVAMIALADERNLA